MALSTGGLVFITGATGFVGFRVLVDALKAGYRARVSVRRQNAINEIKRHPLVAPYVDSLEFVIVRDITVKGAFDSALDGVSYITHLASPLPAEVRSQSPEDFQTYLHIW